MSRKVLCAVYAAVAVAALAATWGQNVVHFRNGGSLIELFEDLKVNPASRSIMGDLTLFFLAAAILMVIEARKHGVNYVWAYILGGFVIAISVTFPLFLLARELRLEKSDATYLRGTDSILLAIMAAAMVAFTIWLDLV